MSADTIWHMYEVQEDESGEIHWVVAPSKEAAAELVMQEDGFTRHELSAFGVRDNIRWPSTFVDGFDSPDDARWWADAGFEVTTDADGTPVVAGTAGQWAAHYAQFGKAVQLSCSDWR